MVFNTPDPHWIERWTTLYGVLHREDGPALIMHDKTCWYLNGQFHREDGPAVTHANGNTEWWFKGELHRIGGPAVENQAGYRYYIDGKPYDDFNEYEKDAKAFTACSKPFEFNLVIDIVFKSGAEKRIVENHKYNYEPYKTLTDMRVKINKLMNVLDRRDSQTMVINDTVIDASEIAMVDFSLEEA